MSAIHICVSASYATFETVKQKLTIGNIALFMCYLIAFALSIKCFREPDLWWQIRTGQWILQNGAVPVADPFSFTFFGKPWINIKWGFEVLAALVSDSLGPESVYLIQAFFSLLLVFFLITLAKAFGRDGIVFNPPKWIIVLGLLLTLFTIEYRIIGRPEMTSHLLTVVFVTLLLRYRKGDFKWIWLLLPLQVLWTNMHEAFGLGLVLVALFTIGTWVEFFIIKDAGLKKKAVLLSVVLALMPIAVLINPRGYVLLLQPLEIFGQVQENKFTTELVPITSYEYWNKEAYLTVGLIVLTLAGVGYKMWQDKKSAKAYTAILNVIPMGYVVIVVALAYLATTAYRNIVFLVLVLFPVLVFAFAQAFRKVEQYSKKIEIALLVLAVGFYGLIVSDKYYEIINSRDHFGLQVLSSNNPIGAAEYLKKQNIQGKGFTDYLVSSYLMWRLRPDFKSFIDLRDLDVFPSSFFQEFIESMVMPDVFAKTDSAYKFDYAVILNRPDFASAHEILRQSGKYKEVFADRVALVYIRGADSVAKDIFSSTPPLPAHLTASAINHLLNPAYSPVKEELYEEDYFATVYYLQAGEYDIALVRAQKAALSKSAKGWEALGRVYQSIAGSAANDSLRNLYNDYATSAYRASNDLKESIAANNGLGSILFRQGNIVGATEYFEQSLKMNPDDINTLMNVAECYKARVNEENGIEKVLRTYRKINRINPDNPNILLQLGAAYTRAGDCSNAREILKKVDGFQGFSPEQQQTVTNCLRQCTN